MRVAAHGERLARAGLSVGEDGLVDAVQCVMNQLLDLLVEDRLSGDLGAEDRVKAERFLRSSVHEGLIADFLPDILILITFGLLWAQWLDSDRHVDLALDHSCLSAIFLLKFII